MNNHQFTNDELEYIYASITDSSQDIYLSNKSTIIAKLPNAKYCLQIKHSKDRQTFCDNLMTFYHIPTITYPKSVGFTIKHNERLELHFVYDNVKDIILSLRQQAVLNNRLTKGLIAQDIERLSKADCDYCSTDLGEKYNRESFYNTIQECLDEDVILWVDDSKPLDDADVKYLRKMKLVQNKKFLTRQKEILDEKLANLQKLEDEIFKH